MISVADINNSAGCQHGAESVLHQELVYVDPKPNPVQIKYTHSGENNIFILTEMNFDQFSNSPPVVYLYHPEKIFL